MKKIHILWRKATEEEIKSKLDSKENPGMFKVSEEEIEVSEQEEEKIDISKFDFSTLSENQIAELKELLKR